MPIIRAAVGTGGILNPTRPVVGSGSTGFDGTGVGLRESATASPNVAANTTTSPAASNRNAHGSPAESRGSVRRRCSTPQTPSSPSATTLPITSQPYRDCHNWPIEPSRTQALATPDSATRTKHQNAIRLYRGAAPGSAVVRRSASSPTSPPTQSAAATTWKARLVTAIWWLPAPDACPVNVGGSTPRIASTAIHATPLRESTSRQPTETASASTVSASSARPCDTSRTKLVSTETSVTRPTGWPRMSAAVNTIRTAAEAVQPNATHDAVRTRR